ncbi:MAG: sigma 54-interacting transcriptional regulator [Bacillota bacterium]|jgi:transcriptional regulator with PAS, ATPase and Fis domain|nr:sigma 54-interacting transcriptional regulator [Bacillota bacterium]
MRPVEQLLSPMTRNRLDVQTLDKNDLILMEKIRQQKDAMVRQRLHFQEMDIVRPDVLESWRRCYDYGLDYNIYNYGPVLDKLTLQEKMHQKDLLLKAADPYICQLEAMLSDAIILLSDEEGAMLRVIEGNEMLRKQNERFNLVPGSVWNESTVGTCAHCISLIQGTPMQICGPEHYFEKYEEISCSSAPIFDINYNLAGSLCVVTSSFSKQSSQSLGLVVSMAWAVQNQFQIALHNDLFNLTLQKTDSALMAINKSGIITKANLVAQQMFVEISQDLIGTHVDQILGEQPLIKSVLESGKPIEDAEIEIDRLNQRVVVSFAKPLNDYCGNNLGCIVALKRINRIKNRETRRDGLNTRFTFDKIIGSSPPIKKVIEIARKFAHLDANILIQGESGTGKEMFAQAIHHESRSSGPFVAVNCGAIPANLIESELFGYEGGSFTGAERRGRAGKLELADGGTLFLDEIGDMPLELQPVLLRVLEEKRLMRIGGNRYVPVNFRLITATNKNLYEQVENNQFRQDLYYRLKVLQIDIPPLRDRSSDILELANYFIRVIAQKQLIVPPVLSDLATIYLLNYHWPGNVRQLENSMLYAVNVCEDNIIRPEDLPQEITSGIDLNLPVNTGTQLHMAQPLTNLSMKDMERIMITQALEQTKYNVSEAAVLLGMSRSTLYRKIKEYQLLKN